MRSDHARLAAALLVLPAAALLAACSSDDPELSVEVLAGAGECPVDLGGAAAGADLEAGPDGGTVEVTEGSGSGGVEASALDRAGGVYVECTQPLEGGPATAVLYAAEEPHAVNLLLPRLQRDLRLGTQDLQDLAGNVAATDTGDLVDLGVDAPAALAGIGVEGAESAVLYVTIPSASPDQARAVAESLLAET